MDADEVDSSFWQVSFFLQQHAWIIFAHIVCLSHICSYLTYCLPVSQPRNCFLLGGVRHEARPLPKEVEVSSFRSQSNGTNDISPPGSSRIAWMSLTLLQLFPSISRSSSLVAPPPSPLHYIFCPRVARHEDHQQGRHHDPSGQENIFS